MTDGTAERTTLRVAGIDLGSNSTRLKIADVEVEGGAAQSLRSTVERTTITRLAEQVDTRGILLPAAIARTRNALAEYRALAREHGAVFALVVATSAVRDADNGEAFLGEVEYSYGFRTQLLDGSQEAQLSFRGLSSDPTLRARVAEGTSLLIDIGGGSTEIVLAQDGVVVDHHSFQIGVVRLTERFGLDIDAPGPSAVAAAREQVLDQVEARFPAPSAPQLALGVAGTVTTLATMAQGLAEYDPACSHGAVIARDYVDRELARCATLTRAQLAQLPGLEARRAPVILAGFTILSAALESFAIDRLVASESDILDGIALRAGEIAVAEAVRELPEPHGRTVC